MTSVLPGRPMSTDGHVSGVRAWALSALLYILFAVVVFAAQGAQPLLGSDHLSYFQMADAMLAKCVDADYWREATSVRTFGVVLAYLHGWTGSHVLSMKLVLAVFTVLYLLAAELFFRLFTPHRWRAVLFAILSGFAVSFGIASWGVTDSTALLPRSLVAPIIMFSMWFWLRHDGKPVKYLAFSFLILGSLLHLSTFYAIGVLLMLEAWDFVVTRRMRFDRLFVAFLESLLLAGLVLFFLEVVGVSSKVIGIQIPEMLRSLGVKIANTEIREPPGCRKAAPKPASAGPAQSLGRIVKVESPAATAGKPSPAPATAKPSPAPATAKPSPAPAKPPSGPATAKPPPPKSPEKETPRPAPRIMAPAAPADTAATPAAKKGAMHAMELWALDIGIRPWSAKEAWDIELNLRPWRNMPLPLVNVANVFSSWALILLLALAGMVVAVRNGLTRHDRVMALMFVAVPIFALGPQTALWALRSYASVYPATIEEVRALSLIMIPSLYFTLRLFDRVIDSGARHARLGAAAIAVAVVALPLFMKNLPHAAREGILSAMTALNVVDPANPSSVVNARSALGLGGTVAPLYYSTQDVRRFLESNTPEGARILTDRDDMILLKGRVIVGPRQVNATQYLATLEQTELFLQTSRAMAAKDIDRLKVLAGSYGADYVMVPWRVDGALFRGDEFSVISIRNEEATTR